MATTTTTTTSIARIRTSAAQLQVGDMLLDIDGGPSHEVRGIAPISGGRVAVSLFAFGPQCRTSRFYANSTPLDIFRKVA